MDFTGVAIGSGVNQYMKMDEMARANKKLEMEKALADQQLSKGQMELGRMRDLDNLNKKYSTINQAVARGEYDHPEVQGFVNSYNQNQGAFNNGYTMSMGQDAKGGRTLNFMDKDGNLVDSQPMDPRNMRRMLNDAYMSERGFTGDDFYKNYALGQKDRELGTDERYKLQVIPDVHRMDNQTRLDAARISTGPQWANINKPHVGSAIQMVDGNGNMVLVNPVTDSQGRTTYNQSQLPAGLKPIPRGAGANPYTTMTDIEKMDYKAYQDGLKELGPRPSDPTKAAQWDNASAALVSQHRVGHLIGGGQQGGPGFNVGAIGGKPSAPAAAASAEAKPTGSGLKKPRSYQDIQAEFKGWTAVPSGDDFVVTDPKGTRMWGSQFKDAYGILPQVLPSK